MAPADAKARFPAKNDTYYRDRATEMWNAGGVDGKQMEGKCEFCHTTAALTVRTYIDNFKRACRSCFIESKINVLQRLDELEHYSENDNPFTLALKKHDPKKDGKIFKWIACCEQCKQTGQMSCTHDVSALPSWK